MTTRLGWYVHHHGRGHLTRLLAIAPRLDAAITCFSSLAAPAELPPNCTWVVLDRDDDLVDGRDPAGAEPTVDGMLHWAPLGHAGHRSRLAAIASAVAADPPDAFVVDVSAEVTLLVRLLGIRPVVLTQPGARDDEPHLLAFRAADTIVAPWPRALMEPPHLAPFADKTVYTGGISRFDGRADGPRRAGGGVVLLGGAGGSAVIEDDIVAASAASDAPWTILSGSGWTADPWTALRDADVVVSWAGQNAIADLAAVDARAIVVPQERPFREQAGTADALHRAGLAVVQSSWPARTAWPALLERARGLRPDWSRWQVHGGAGRAADAIMAAARSRA
ncbi:glycosyltransferase [Planococcus sp. APC 4015]|nr:glycosyltransferase [Planococcus sp. APC 4015]